jgi:hypothetical protein
MQGLESPVHVYTTFICCPVYEKVEWGPLQIRYNVISVGFWRWCVSIKRIVLLDFIHRLVSEKNKQNWGIKNMDQGFMCVCAQVSCSVVSNWPLYEFCGCVYCDILSIFLIPQFCLFFFWDTRQWIKSKSTIRSIRYNVLLNTLRTPIRVWNIVS